jgi:predicted O-linked N-acetylglucosamine transferase (SPINDLY family)
MFESTAFPENYGQLAHQCLSDGKYSKASEFYEQAIAIEPVTKSHYWYYGLTLLLAGQETEAQMAWMLAMSEGEAEEVDVWNRELFEILETEAQRQEELEADSLAWTIRQYIKEIDATNINNLLKIILLSIKLNNLREEDLNNLGIIELLNTQIELILSSLNYSLFINFLSAVLNYDPPLVSYLPKLVEASLPYIQSPGDLINLVIPVSNSIARGSWEYKLVIEIIELCLHLDPECLELLSLLTAFYEEIREYEKAIKTARLCLALSKTLPEKIYANYQLLGSLLTSGGHWQEALTVFQEQDNLLLSLVAENPLNLDSSNTQRLISSNFFFPYLRDHPVLNRRIQNQIIEICQANILVHAGHRSEKYRQLHIQNKQVNTRKPRFKIGYLSHCLKIHSVGWLARWLIQHHDREQFDLYGYFINAKRRNDSLQQWYLNQFNKSHKFESSGIDIAEQVVEDGIDILVDLDSITINVSCVTMSLKPAPVQVTWLGLDASGFPNIDYFIADPYVLPVTAQDYYQEKIWRLPQTYIAVDGFEVGVPTLRRDHLNIPSDAVVYFCGQRGFKSHPDTARLHLKIIKEVPNSYFLVKRLGDEQAIRKMLIQLAEEEGVSPDRLKFLPEDNFESVHRANLAIADIVLDTYPYNGATTTLETLWMGIPLVTRVGEQFAARNSYTMMMNAGITEGIAWNDEEYIEWGVRLGKDEKLRQQVAWKLRQSRQTAPLWNGKQFAREMEKAYQQMWELRG